MQSETGDLLNMTISSTSPVTSTQVKRDLNTARNLVFNRLLTLGQNYNVRLAKADLVSSQSLYGLPSDCRKISRIELGYDSESQRYKANQLDITEIDPDSGAVYSPVHPMYTIIGDMYEVRPTPSQNTTNGIYIYYIENIVDMSADSDVSSIPFDYDHLLPLYAAAKGKYTLGLQAEGDDLMSQFKNDLYEMENDIVERNIDSNGRISITDDYGGL